MKIFNKYNILMFGAMLWISSISIPIYVPVWLHINPIPIRITPLCVLYGPVGTTVPDSLLIFFYVLFKVKEDDIPNVY